MVQTSNVKGPPYSTEGVAVLYVQPVWRIRYLYSKGLVPPAPKLGGRYLAIPAEHLPLIEAALRARGWLAGEDVSATEGQSVGAATGANE